MEINTNVFCYSYGFNEVIIGICGIYKKNSLNYWKLTNKKESSPTKNSKRKRFSGNVKLLSQISMSQKFIKYVIVSSFSII